MYSYANKLINVAQFISLSIKSIYNKKPYTNDSRLFVITTAFHTLHRYK